MTLVDDSPPSREARFRPRSAVEHGCADIPSTAPRDGLNDSTSRSSAYANFTRGRASETRPIRRARFRTPNFTSRPIVWPNSLLRTTRIREPRPRGDRKRQGRPSPTRLAFSKRSRNCVPFVQGSSDGKGRFWLNRGDFRRSPDLATGSTTPRDSENRPDRISACCRAYRSRRHATVIQSRRTHVGGRLEAGQPRRVANDQAS